MTSPVDDPDQQQQPPPSDALNRRFSIITDDAAASTDYEDDHDDSIYDEARKHPLERRMTNDANAHPGDVRINVKGAFIVEPPIEEMQEQLGLLDAKLGANDSAGRAPISRESSSLASGQQTPTPGDRFDEEGYMHDPKDIRLPFHKSVVSHIALDVCKRNFQTARHPLYFGSRQLTSLTNRSADPSPNSSTLAMNKTRPVFLWAAASTSLSLRPRRSTCA